MRRLFKFLTVLLTCFSLTKSNCPQSSNNLRRVGTSRYFIIQNSLKRGQFVTIEQARKDCAKHNMKLATVKNMLSLAVVGRQLEKLVFVEKLKDTWCTDWLDAKYDNTIQKYHWGDDEKDALKYSLILYRYPRPIGVSSHITYNNDYQKDEDKPQCLTLALPWLGSADHNESTTVFFGHQTSFDERDCKSQKKRHAICEANEQECKKNYSNPFVLDEGKYDYFESGNWLFGDRKYIVNWQQRTFNESERYCKSLGLQIMIPGLLEKWLIPHIKMWSRGITASQFWTGMAYNESSHQYLDSIGEVLATETNFTKNEPLFNVRSSKNSGIFCVALSLAYEFLEQMPCSNPSSPGCQWSFIRYAPANCNNFHGTICQHENYDERNISWFSKYKTDLSDVLVQTALTAEFGFKGNQLILRSKYKQTFGTCYCPKNYRMIRSINNINIAWSVKPHGKDDKELYLYDYQESYWMVDKEMFNKTINSTCTVSYFDGSSRKLKNVSCTEWHFYVCERIGKRPTKSQNLIINVSPPMRWNDEVQPRVYPILSNVNCTPYDQTPCGCALRLGEFCGYNTVTNKCVARWRECPSYTFENEFCQRSGNHIFYTVGGLVCNSQSTIEQCTIGKQLYAVNFFGENQSDIRNISYLTESGERQKWVIPSGHYNAQSSKFTVLGVPQQDEKLYSGYMGSAYHIISNTNHGPRDYCSYLLFETAGDGIYEISLKVGEMHWGASTNNMRIFSILLDDIYIVREFLVENYRKNPNGFELITNFKIFHNNTMLKLQGHPSDKIKRKDSKLRFELCFSFCYKSGYRQVDANWLTTAMSVVKFAG